jgi:hypothetical protein
VPQAYDAFSSAYRRAGERLTADRLLIERKDIENATYFRRLKPRWYNLRYWKHWTFAAVVLLAFAANQLLGVFFQDPSQWDDNRIVFSIAASVFLLWPFVASLFQMLFKFLFRYGLSAERALVVFSSCIAIGWIGVHFARHGRVDIAAAWSAETAGIGLPPGAVLVRDVADEPADAQASAPPRSRIRAPATVAVPSPCDRDVSSLLYALDVFIPLVDLEQENRCKVRDAPRTSGDDPYFIWRLGKALYELIGWLVTSLVILTISGVLRRDLER